MFIKQNSQRDLSTFQDLRSEKHIILVRCYSDVKIVIHYMYYLKDVSSKRQINIISPSISELCYPNTAVSFTAQRDYVKAIKGYTEQLQNSGDIKQRKVYINECI